MSTSKISTPHAGLQTHSSGIAPPNAKRSAKVVTVHGDERQDDYFWIRDKEDSEVIAYLEAENAYAAAVMKPTEALQQKLYDEMLGRIKEDDLSVPYRRGDYLYFRRTQQGQQYPSYCRRHESGSGEEVILNLNEQGAGQPFVILGCYVVSDDGNFLAYSTDQTGGGSYTLQIKDLCTGQILPETTQDVRSVAWDSLSQTIFYTTEDSTTRRCYRLFRRVVGSNQSTLVYEEDDELFDLELARSRDRQYILLTSVSKITTEVRFIPASQPTAAAQIVSPRMEGHQYFVEHRAGSFFIRTNLGAKNFRIVTVPATDSRQQNWHELVPHQPAVRLDQLELFSAHCVLMEREGGLQHIRVIDLRTGSSHLVEFDEPVYLIKGAANHEFNTGTFRFGYQSPVTPESVFDYNLDTRERKLLKQCPVLGGYDPSRYRCERIFATAADGTHLPVSLVYQKDVPLNGFNPLILQGYGAYGITFPATFSSPLLSLLDRGFVCAIAHVRGGGEMGEAWHEAGRLMSKQNTFTDYVQIAEHLIEKKYTGQGRLVAWGNSAGGLLVGAATNMRPDLFKAAVLEVPFVDVLNTMLDPKLPLTIGEYLEWGDPNEINTYQYLKTYSPYDNLEAKAYPAMLIRTSFNDGLVMYWEAAKYVAKLRALKTDTEPVLLKINMSGGHGGSSGFYEGLREVAFDYAFILSQFEIDD